MLATTIDMPDIPPSWSAAVQQIQAAVEPPTSLYPDSTGKVFSYITGAASTVLLHHRDVLSIEQLGWSPAEALETHLRFRNFAEDWNAPGMEDYDDM